MNKISLILFLLLPWVISGCKPKQDVKSEALAALIIPITEFSEARLEAMDLSPDAGHNRYSRRVIDLHRNFDHFNFNLSTAYRCIGASSSRSPIKWKLTP
jgi:hypothetical protein